MKGLPGRSLSRWRALLMLAWLGCTAASSVLQAIESSGRPVRPACDERDPFLDDEDPDPLAEQLNREPPEKLLENTIVPEVRFEKASIEEICLELMTLSHRLNPAREKLDIELSDIRKARPVTFEARNRSLRQVLEQVVKEAGLHLHVNAYSVEVGGARPAMESLRTRTFRVGPGYPSLIGGFGERSLAPAARNYDLKRMFMQRGIDFPEGSDLSYDGEMLTVTTTGHSMELVEVLADVSFKPAPRQIHVRAEIYGLPQLDALRMIERYDRKPEVSDLVTELRAMVKEGKATLEAAPSITTKSATRARTRLGRARDFLGSYVAKDGREVPKIDELFLGTVLEVDPLLGADNRTIDITLGVHHTFGDPVFGERTMIGPISGRERVVETVEVSQGKLINAMTYQEGQTRFLGTLTAPKADPTKSYLVFAKVWVTAVADE